MPGQVAMTTMSPAKMRRKNLRFFPTSFPFLAASHSLCHRFSYRRHSHHFLALVYIMEL
jgi:hypothetical protein